MKKYVSVIGGINIDIKGLPKNILLSDTSNPGSIYLSPGGVGRNIAHNLALLDIPVYFFGAIGEDVFGSRVLSKTEVAGVNVTYVQVLNNQHTGMYLSILDGSHELALAISDMEITHCIDKKYIDKHRKVIQCSDFVILETNLDLEVLGYVLELCSQKNIPCLINPVCVEKAQKLHDIAGDFEYITTNRAELGALCHREIHHLDELEDLCEQVSDKCEHILVTLGEDGVYYYNRTHRNGRLHPSFKTQIVDPNGAGDAFVAGLVCGLFRNFTMDDSIQLGMVAAHLTLQSEDTVYEELSFERCSSLLTKINCSHEATKPRRKRIEH